MVLTDQWTGGAASAAKKLMRGLVEGGIEVLHILPDQLLDVRERNKDWPIEGLIDYRARQGLEFLLGHNSLKALGHYLVYSYQLFRLKRFLHYYKPDVINLHNLHMAGWDMRIVKLCVESAPTVWSLHDMWSFTGRCTYSYDCEKFKKGCDSNCPTANEYPVLPSNKIASSWAQRKDFITKNKNRLTAVATTTWMKREAQSSFWKNIRVDYIPYGIPLDRLCPVEKSLARKVLGIKEELPVFVTVADDPGEKRKGGPVLFEALPSINELGVNLIIIGQPYLELDRKYENIHFVGRVDYKTLGLYYSGADYFLSPALADNLAHAILESLACGTPVVGFDVGGLSDVVIEEKTGWLTKSLTAASLVQLMKKAIDENIPYQVLSQNCLNIVQQNCSLEREINQYIQLFKEVA